MRAQRALVTGGATGSLKVTYASGYSPTGIRFGHARPEGNKESNEYC